MILGNSERQKSAQRRISPETPSVESALEHLVAAVNEFLRGDTDQDYLEFRLRRARQALAARIQIPTEEFDRLSRLYAHAAEKVHEEFLRKYAEEMADEIFVQVDPNDMLEVIASYAESREELATQAANASGANAD